MDRRGHPKIELHLHLEQAVDAATLLAFARRNDVALPADTVEGLTELMAFRDLAHFVQIARATMQGFCTERDFREALVAYATAAHAQGVVYLEASFSPSVHARRGVAWEAMFDGVCDGAQQAREELGIEVRVTPDISRDSDLDSARELVRHAIAYRDRGVVGIGIAGPEAGHPPGRFADVFAQARAEGLASLPHAGEAAGSESVDEALRTLAPDRIRHGVRAVEDAGVLGELANRSIVCDVCLHSNLRLGVVASLAEHPLPRMIDAGVACTVGTDDPTFFDCDITREHDAARSLGVDARALFAAGVAGARCDETTRVRLQGILDDDPWAS